MNEQGFALVLVATATAMAISLLLSASHDHRAMSLRWWALGLLLSPLGWLLYRIGAAQSMLVAAVLGKALVALGMALYLRSLMSLDGDTKATPRWLYRVPAAIIAFSLLHLWVWPDRPLGSGLLSLICSGLALACGICALRLDRIADSSTHGRVLALNFCVIAVLSILRAALLLMPPGSLFSPALAEALSQDWLVALMILAPIIGTVNLALIERDELTNQYRRMAQTDHLTGVANRAHVLEGLRKKFESARQQLHALALLIIDIDHFKAVNDEHGHQVGDQVLHEVCKSIQAGLPLSATLGRIGGEEFLVVLERTSIEDALGIAERLRSSVANNPTAHANGWIRSTVSIGCAVRMADDHGFSDLIRRADQAMYVAKQAGRNRVSQVYRPLTKSGVDSPRLRSAAKAT